MSFWSPTRLSGECVSIGPARDILAYGVKHGMKTLRLCGLEKVLEGTTSIEEVMRITKGVRRFKRRIPAAASQGWPAALSESESSYCVAYQFGP